MSYFNHAFNKTFVGTNGFVSTATTKTSALTAGQFAFVDPKTWEVPADVDTSSSLKCPLVLASASIHLGNDKIGPFAGGYAESVKSKTINPKYVSAFYKVNPCPLQQMQITVGSNSETYECNLNSGTVVNKEFLCNTTYNLRVDIKGSPVLRFLTRNTYYTAAAYTGCCAEGVDGIGQPVNPLIVYVQWAYQLLNSPLISPFIQVRITYSTDPATAAWQELAGTDGTNSAANLEALLNYINDPSTLPTVDNYTAVTGLGRAGLIITGAYVDTRFNDCTFYPNDSIIAFLEPVKIYASEVDLNGDPCAFGGICVANVCAGNQGTGFGESAIRDLIMTESYMQQPFYTGTDLRIREITNGTDVYDAISRTSTYTRYYIQHNVPRFNNPSGTFDNDQYLLEILVPKVSKYAAASTTSTTVYVWDTSGIAIGQSMYINGTDSGSNVLSIASTPTSSGVYEGMYAITIDGAETVPAGAYLEFVVDAVESSLATFEGFMQDWLNNANSGCVATFVSNRLVPINCADGCTYAPFNVNAPALG
ncbi:MAG: hypothetical protein RLZZ196_714 [Bacteroidota bacterium]|jgi:hypothetical protein